MRNVLLLSAATLALAACDNPSTAPADALIGRWGGGGFELVANDRDVQVAAPCSVRLTARGPIIPYQGTRFIVSLERDRTGQLGLNAQSTGAHAISGTIAGDRITVELNSITIGGNSKRTFELVRGAPKGPELNCDA